MTEFTNEFIAELKNIVSKATPTPYYFCVYPDQISENETHPLEGKELKIIACPGDGNHIFGIFAEGEWVNDYFDFVENNAEYIVIACNNLPKALDHIERQAQRIAELEQEQKVYCTADGEYPDHNDNVIFQCFCDEMSSIGYFSKTSNCFVAKDSYAYYPENYAIYWKHATSLKDEYERQKENA